MSIAHRWLLVLPFAFAATNLAVAADEAPRYNQIQFQVERSRPVENDRMQATLSITAEDPSAARLADQINRTMDWAIATAKTRNKVEHRSGGYQTYPIYEKDKVQGWRATQELLLEGPDFTQMGELIGKLQERLQVNAITFSVSPERRATVEDELIANALEAFKQRADLVRKQLAAKEYRIVNVSINHDGTAPIPKPMMRSSVIMETASVAAPAVQAGTSILSVSVSAVIELQ